MTTKSFSALLLSLAILAPLAAACSSADSSPPDKDGEQGSEESEIKKGKKKSCASVGGACVGLSPSSCSGGTWADAAQVSCGGGLGVGCCVPNAPPPPPPAKNACETAGGACMGLTPANCKDGEWADYATHSCGSGVGVGCCVKKTAPPPANACEAAGGKCVGLAPSSCASGHWADAASHPCGTGIGVGCCLP